ncbi:MAG: phosphoserine phosphatase SerB [Robiginitomaculum sp.]|nr:MAG: phosphoserine phosphatase SerB [Robiginitomaculum sp.]
MEHILSVVAKPGHRDLDLAVQSLQANGFALGRQLAPRQAVELRGIASTAQLDLWLGQLQVDWCRHPTPPTQKDVLLCDMDSTIIGQECIDELADLASIGPQVKQITAAAMAGKLDFAQALRERVRLLAGQSEELLSRCWSTRISINAGAKTLVATMNQLGSKTALVSGGFTWFADRVAKVVQFGESHANQLAITDQQITGKIEGPIVDGAVKLAHLQRLCQDPARVMAIGDGANDLLMVEAAGLGLAYHAKPILLRKADGRIRHTDLTTALFFQGITKTDWDVCD